MSTKRFTTLALTPFLIAACIGDGPVDVVPDASTSDAGTDVAIKDGAPEAAPTCGAPGIPCCNGTCNGGSVCVAGSCACNAPKATTCGVTCVDLQSDAKNCGACAHDCLGGTCTGGKCQPITIATGQTNFSGIALDATNAYWTRSGDNFVMGSLSTVKLDGTGLKPLSTNALNQSDFSPAVVGGAVYFVATNPSLRSVMKCTLPDCTGGATVIAPSQQLAFSVAIDTVNNRLYWVNGTAFNQSTGGSVMTYPLPSGPATRVASADQPNPDGLVLGNGFVYWINGGTYSSSNHQGNGDVRRAPLGQTNGGSTTIVAFSTPDLGGIAVDAQSVYFGSGSGFTLEVAPVGGGGSSSKLANVPGGLHTVVADGTNVYWTEDLATTGRVLMCPRTGCPGGNPIVLATGQDSPRAIAVDAVSVVWGNSMGGEIRRLAK